MTESYSLELLSHIKRETLPLSWYECANLIKEDEQWLDMLLSSNDPPPIYGVNRLVGHLDDVEITNQEIRKFQKNLIDNHCLGTEPYYTSFEAKCISYVKANAISLGGTGVTFRLFDLLLKTIRDKDFQPRIPLSSSYSSGDVIPAAHWTKDLIVYLEEKYDYELKRKEGISLINGSFIHLGVALAKLSSLQKTWDSYLFASILNANTVEANQSNYSEHINSNPKSSINNISKRLKKYLKSDNIYKKQDPISIRSLLQVSSTLAETMKFYMNSLDQELTSRSDNPLVISGCDEPLSQGSFLSPIVTVSTSQLIESILMTMWTVERRVHHLLSGHVEGIPQNGGQSESDLGFIQVPKLMTAILEETRMVAGEGHLHPVRLLRME